VFVSVASSANYAGRSCIVPIDPSNPEPNSAWTEALRALPAVRATGVTGRERNGDGSVRRRGSICSSSSEPSFACWSEIFLPSPPRSPARCPGERHPLHRLPEPHRRRSCRDLIPTLYPPRRTRAHLIGPERAPSPAVNRTCPARSGRSNVPRNPTTRRGSVRRPPSVPRAPACRPPAQWRYRTSVRHPR
jgi:hypothetical protein